LARAEYDLNNDPQNEFKAAASLPNNTVKQVNDAGICHQTHLFFLLRTDSATARAEILF
jgi:hypothetical protein